MTFTDWLPDLNDRDMPIYLAIVEAIERDIAAGILDHGTRLPPQRTLAGRLGIDFTTVSRAYAEARRRGLIDARVGKGSFVKASRNAAPTASAGSAIDMMVNHPPCFDDPELHRRLWQGLPTADVAMLSNALMRYHPPAGSTQDRAVGASWLSNRVGPLPPERLLVCPGTQGALLVATLLLASPGDAICVEALTYPGFILIAQQLGIRLVPVEMDEYGALPESLDRVCRKHRPKAFYCMPTLHNPTCAIMPSGRRGEIANVLRQHALPFIEDDNYWPLLDAGSTAAAGLPPLASLVPELAYYITGLAKCVSPAIRIAYMATPDRASAERAAVVLRATASMAAPLNAALASRWILDGTAAGALKAIRDETAARREIARRILPRIIADASPAAFHLWMRIPPPWTRATFIEKLRENGVAIAASDAFAVVSAPEAARICLGGPTNRAELAHGLQRIADLLTESPALSIIV